MLEEEGRRKIVAGVRRLSGQHLKEHATQCVDVRACVYDLASSLFGRHVDRRTEHITRKREPDLVQTRASPKSDKYA